MDSLSQVVGTMSLLGDESRLRLCALLRDRELCVNDLVRITGLTQSRVSTHLGRLKEAGLVRDRRRGTQSLHALSEGGLSSTVRALLDEAMASSDPTLAADQKRLRELEGERSGDSGADDFERDYSPGRTWQSLLAGIAPLLALGDVLDVGSGDGAAAAVLAPYCRSLTCIDANPRMLELSKERLRKHRARVELADAHDLPFSDGSFDAVLLFHTLTYAERPERVVEECARVLRPGGRLVLVCLGEHEQLALTARYGERHPGFSPGAVRRLLTRAGLAVVSSTVACREPKKARLEVVLGVADKPREPSKAS